MTIVYYHYFQSVYFLISSIYINILNGARYYFKNLDLAYQWFFSGTWIYPLLLLITLGEEEKFDREI